MDHDLISLPVLNFEILPALIDERVRCVLVLKHVTIGFFGACQFQRPHSTLKDNQQQLHISGICPKKERLTCPSFWGEPQN